MLRAKTIHYQTQNRPIALKPGQHPPPLQEHLANGEQIVYSHSTSLAAGG
jgi:hypothetical protein